MPRTIDYQQWQRDLEETRRRSRALLDGLDLARFPRVRPRNPEEERWLREREARLAAAENAGPATEGKSSPRDDDSERGPGS